MLEKFIQLVELQAKVCELKAEIEEIDPYGICSLDKIQLMAKSQKLFDDFCQYVKLVSVVKEYEIDNKHCIKEFVIYKGIEICVYDDSLIEELDGK